MSGVSSARARMFDAIVVGSGFGGAVTACRLAEKGAKVLVLERGRRWEPRDYPREPNDAWLWSTVRPHRLNGWLDFRCFPRMAVAQGAGVGGGSLIYANVVVDAREEFFAEGWPPEVTYAALRPYYDRVAAMLKAVPVPETQLTERFRLTRDAARHTRTGDRFQPVPLAITFDPNWHYELEDPFNVNRSQPWVNEHGQPQGTCVHCGNCVIGCPTRAKNTLDLNYIPRAEQRGAVVRPLHLVTRVEPDAGAYRVHFDRLDNGRRVSGSERAARVILAAGSLGTTELLLRCRDEYGTLPHVSACLGRNWSSNADFLTPAFYRDRAVSPTRGPTITCAIDFLDRSTGNAAFFIEDGGFPDIFGNYLGERFSRGTTSPSWQILLNAMSQLVRMRDPLRNVMPWFAQGHDAADGRLYLGRGWRAPWRRKLKLKWKIARSKGVIEAIIHTHERLSKATGGVPRVPPSWTVFKTLVTPHPLGGCNMSTSPLTGVVNHEGEVFGHPRLYVADGSIIPKAIGRNPSKTIAALAERIAALIRS